MRRCLILLVFLTFLPLRVCAMDYTAPTVPENAEIYMPENTQSFAEGFWEVLSNALQMLDPPFMEAVEICSKLLAATLLITLVSNIRGTPSRTAEFVGALCVAVLLITPSNSLISLGADTVRQMSDYGKLLLPVMTAAMAAQGGVTASTALYAGTAMFDAILSGIISAVTVPLLYIYLALIVAHAAIGEDILKRISDLVRWFCTWVLKTLLYIFTGYIGLTGVISGTTDAAAMKVAKMTISGAVPVVGGILSDASEAILVSVGVMKNAAGIYGIFAVLAIFAGPFLRIGVHYLMLKLTAAVSSVYAPKRVTELIGQMSSAMGMLLGMTGAVCVMLMISTVCYMRGVG